MSEYLLLVILFFACSVTIWGGGAVLYLAVLIVYLNIREEVVVRRHKREKRIE